MEVPVITLKQAEKAVKEHHFKLHKKVCSKRSLKKANKFEKKHGFRYEDAWQLDHAIACFVLPRLVQLRDTTHGFPAIFAGDGGEQEWEKILNEMIYGFYIYVVKDWVDWTDEDKKIWFTAKCWFCRYFSDLWD